MKKSNKKEKIELTDFIKDAIKSLGLDENALRPKYVTNYICPTCKRNYSKGDKFCTKDGAEIIEKQIEVKSKEADVFIRHTLFYLTEQKIPEDFPYEYIDSVEKRGDGEGYHMNYIFKRKSDDKFFVYTSYDGRIENDCSDETTQEITVKWDFEKFFS